VKDGLDITKGYDLQFVGHGVGKKM
jgi:hypothetical protein